MASNLGGDSAPLPHWQDFYVIDRQDDYILTNNGKFIIDPNGKELWLTPSGDDIVKGHYDINYRSNA